MKRSCVVVARRVYIRIWTLRWVEGGVRRNVELSLRSWEKVGCGFCQEGVAKLRDNSMMSLLCRS